jgi:hypothetical protein
MAGSDFFRRTKSFGGEAETQAAQDWVHVAITYSEQGKIRCYRNGKLYGSAYDSTPQKFAAGKSQILFGLRHSPAASNKLWQGRIERAQLYDRALTDEEIAMSAGALNDFISREKLLAALTEDQRVTLQQQENELAKLNAEMQSLVSESNKPDEELSRWRDLCQSLFNWKEFLYLR